MKQLRKEGEERSLQLRKEFEFRMQHWVGLLSFYFSAFVWLGIKFIYFE